VGSLPIYQLEWCEVVHFVGCISQFASTGAASGEQHYTHSILLEKARQGRECRVTTGDDDSLAANCGVARCIIQECLVRTIYTSGDKEVFGSNE